MPHCTFYATPEDIKELLAFVIEKLPVKVFESYSNFDTCIEEFKTIQDIINRYPLWQKGESRQLLLSLWPINASKNVFFRKINLEVEGHSFRYTTEGWGLIQLHLGYTDPNRKKIISSYTNHNSEKRALKWHSTYEDLGLPSDWNWKEVNTVSSTLNRYIKKCSVDKIGSNPILPQAKLLIEQQYELALF